MNRISSLLSQSCGVPLTSYLRDGLVNASIRALLDRNADRILVHRDRASFQALAEVGAHGCCQGDRVFLGSAVGTSLGPDISQVLHHELVHVAQVELGRRTAKIAAPLRLEEEACCIAEGKLPPAALAHGASPDHIYPFWWLLPLAAAAYVLLRPNVANAPEPGSRTYPSVPPAQVAGEALALFAVPEIVAGSLPASLGIGSLGRFTIGFWPRLAVGGGASMMSYRAVGDVARGEFSGVQTYLVDGATGMIVGVVVPGGIRLAGSAVTYPLDWLAMQGMRNADFAISTEIARRAAVSPVTADELTRIFQARNLNGEMAEWWLNRRGQMIVYRGQEAATTSILSPIARSNGVAASEQLVAKMRAEGITNAEMAKYTAFWHHEPVPAFDTLPKLAGQPLGGVGIPTTRIPGLAANFGQNGVVYVIRLPKASIIRVPRWGLSVEHEWVVLNQMPAEASIQMVPAKSFPSLTVDEAGRLVPGIPNGGVGVAAPIVKLSKSTSLPMAVAPRLPKFGVRPLFDHVKDPPDAGRLSQDTSCFQMNSDVAPVCTTTTTYVVKSGDSLWALAQRFYGDPQQYNKLYEANKGVLGPVATKPKLQPGVRLTIP